LQGAGHAWALAPAQGDGDLAWGVVDGSAEVEQVAQDGPVFVGVGQVGVEVFGQPRFGVQREQLQHHLQVAAGQVGAGSLRVWVQLGGQDLGRRGLQRRLGLFEGSSRLGVEVAAGAGN